MIDEELYQRATDELNSDRRRAHLWARACALSSDDHDEARYLYTNLRVEELIAERGREDASPSAAPSGTGTDPDALAGLTLEPLEPPGSDDAADGAPKLASDDTGAGFDDTEPDTPFETAFDSPAGRSAVADAVPPSSTRAGIDAPARGALEGADAAATHSLDTGPDAALDVRPDDAPEANLDAALDGSPPPTDRPDAMRPESVRDRMRFDLDESAVDLDADEIVRLDDPDADPVSPLANRPPPAKPAPPEDASPTPATGAAARPHAGGRPHAGDAGHGRPPPARDVRVRLHDVDDQLDEVIDGGGGASAAARRAFGSRVRGDYADARDLDALLDDRRADHADRDGGDGLEVIEEDGGPGRRWSVLEAEDGALRAVKRGVCWPALVATLPWLVARGLLGTGIVYALLWIVALGGLVMTGLEWRDAGESVPDVTVFAFAGFAVIAFAGLVLVPFLRANRWRTRKLLRRGWEIAGELRARSADEALSRFRELDAGRG